MGAKTSEWFGEMRVGARSAAGSMTALSQAPNVREHRFQMHHYRNCARDPLSRGFEPLSFAYLFFAALHVRLVVASPEPIDVKMEGGQRMEDETLFSGNPGMGNP
ncbi:MAG: hypothetical protein WBR17_06880, partial [Paraburkholderia sp.]